MKHSRFEAARILDLLESDLPEFTWRKVDIGEGWIICHDDYVPLPQRIRAAQIESVAVKTEMTRLLPVSNTALVKLLDDVNLSREKWEFLLSGQPLIAWSLYDHVKGLNSKCPLCDYSHQLAKYDDFCFVCPIEYSDWCSTKYHGDFLRPERAWAEGTREKDIKEIIMILKELAEVITVKIREIESIR